MERIPFDIDVEELRFTFSKSQDTWLPIAKFNDIDDAEDYVEWMNDKVIRGRGLFEANKWALGSRPETLAGNMDL